jgi:hypothetical protein
MLKNDADSTFTEIVPYFGISMDLISDYSGVG